MVWWCRGKPQYLLPKTPRLFCLCHWAAKACQTRPWRMKNMVDGCGGQCCWWRYFAKAIYVWRGRVSASTSKPNSWASRRLCLEGAFLLLLALDPSRSFRLGQQKASHGLIHYKHDWCVNQQRRGLTQPCHLRGKMVQQRVLVFRLGGGIKILEENSLDFQEEVSVTQEKPTKILIWQLEMSLFSLKRIVLVGPGVI